MSRRLTGAAAIGCALILAGCQTPAAPAANAGPSLGAAVGSLVGTTAERFVSPATIARVQADVRKGCNFEVEADTVVKVGASLAGYGVIGTAFDLATTHICDAAKQSAMTASLDDRASYAALKRRKAKPVDTTKGVTPEGVPVKGRFVKPKG